MKKHLISLALACAVGNVYADQVTLRFLNCTGKELIANWSGYNVNINHAAVNDILQGQIKLPKGKKLVTKTLEIYRADINSRDEHKFSMFFVQGMSGKVDLAFTNYIVTNGNNLPIYGNRITMTSSSNIYLPKTLIEVSQTTAPIPNADIQIGCQ
jgi:hypothetical protein